MTERFGYDDASRARDFVEDKMRDHGMEASDVKDGVVLGSGLGTFVDESMDGEYAGEESGPLVIPYSEIFKHLGIDGGDDAGVPGHAKNLVVGPVRGGSGELVIAQNGREHLYEGTDIKRAVFWLRVMQSLGVQTLVGSNAAGIVTPGEQGLTPPATMLVMGHVDETGANPLTGHNDERFGPRFPHGSDFYPAATRALFRRLADTAGVELKEGIYVRKAGPNYETPDEIYLLRNELEALWKRGSKQPAEKRYGGFPVGVVGMSSTYEAQVAQHASQAGLEGEKGALPAFQKHRAYLSVATNYAGALGPEGPVVPSNHREVQENARIVQESFGNLVRRAVLAFQAERSGLEE